MSKKVKVSQSDAVLYSRLNDSDTSRKIVLKSQVSTVRKSKIGECTTKKHKKKNKVLADFLSLILSSYLKQWWDKDRKMGIQVPPAVGICSEENKWPSCTHIMNRSWCILTLSYVLLVCSSPINCHAIPAKVTACPRNIYVKYGKLLDSRMHKKICQA